MTSALSTFDPEVAGIVAAETRRQRDGLELIASENFVSEAVLEAVGSPLTNKYAEGLPGRRYYGGCEEVDKVERLAQERAKKLFGCDHVNVQPHSGSQANMAAYLSVLGLHNPVAGGCKGDRILSMSLAQGGHLTHGAPVNFSGRLFEVHHYGLDPSTERLDYDAAAQLARELRPKMIVAGASSYARLIDFDTLAQIARDVGAYFLCDIAHIAGLVAVGLHPSPVAVADFVTTTTHKTLRGPRSGLAMCKAEHAKALDSQVFPGLQGGPLMHVVAGKAVAFGEALQPSFRAYQERVLASARALAESLAGHGFRLVSGGTDNHLVLVDVRSKGLTGKVAEAALGRAGITANKNMIPFDPEKPMVTSGVRLGTPALCSRGMGPSELTVVGDLIAETLAAPDDEANLTRVHAKVREVAGRFPLYPSRA
jgi:glycine hydroxymethyltransferase